MGLTKWSVLLFVQRVIVLLSSGNYHDASDAFLLGSNDSSEGGVPLYTELVSPN